MCVHVWACVCVCVCVCLCLFVTEDVGCLCPNRIKTYFSCGFWFALATTLIHQDKQHMKKCAADSFESGNVSTNAVGTGWTRCHSARHYPCPLYLSMCVVVLLRWWISSFLSITSSGEHQCIRMWCTRFCSGLEKEQIWLKLWANAVSKHLMKWFSGDSLFRFDSSELLSINYSHSENNSQPSCIFL